MDPVTIIVTALAAGAAAGLQDTVQQAVADAYGALKAVIQRKYAGVSFDQLETAPDLAARQAVVREDLARTDAGQDPEVLQQAQALLAAIRAHPPDVVGVNLENVDAASLRLTDILATGAGVGAGGRADGGRRSRTLGGARRA